MITLYWKLTIEIADKCCKTIIMSNQKYQLFFLREHGKELYDLTGAKHCGSHFMVTCYNLLFTLWWSWVPKEIFLLKEYFCKQLLGVSILISTELFLETAAKIIIHSLSWRKNSEKNLEAFLRSTEFVKEDILKH